METVVMVQATVIFRRVVVIVTNELSLVAVAFRNLRSGREVYVRWVVRDEIVSKVIVGYLNSGKIDSKRRRRKLESRKPREVVWEVEKFVVLPEST